MEDGNDDGNNGVSISNPKILIFIAGMGSAALLVAIYHCITVGWCDPRRPRASTSSPGGLPNRTQKGHSGIQLIPAHKYKKGEELLRDDGTCSICLCEFEEGEELRTLPECAHSFHAPCIDMWLYSQLSCPMCRAAAAAPPQIVRAQSTDVDLEDTTVLERVIVQPHVT